MSIRKQLILPVLLLAFSSISFADESNKPTAEDRWNRLPAEQQERLSAKAAEHGHDLSTEAGRAAYFAAARKKHHAQDRQHNRKHRDKISMEDRWNRMPPERQAELTAKAAEKGFDITTEDGRKAFREAHRDQHAGIRERIRALDPQDREALRNDLKGLDRQQKRELIRQRLGS